MWGDRTLCGDPDIVASNLAVIREIWLQLPHDPEILFSFLCVYEVLSHAQGQKWGYLLIMAVVWLWRHGQRKFTEDIRWTTLQKSGAMNWVYTERKTSSTLCALCVLIKYSQTNLWYSWSYSPSRMKKLKAENLSKFHITQRGNSWFELGSGFSPEVILFLFLILLEISNIHKDRTI